MDLLQEISNVLRLQKDNNYKFINMIIIKILDSLKLHFLKLKNAPVKPPKIQNT